MPHILDRAAAEQYLRSTKGKWFSVLFTKRDGSKRLLNGRLGVRKHLRGGPQAYNPAEHNLLIAWDRHADGSGGYRAVPLDRLIKVKVKGKWFRVK